jgi:tetratricopeptide (TPR) repeat protein
MDGRVRDALATLNEPPTPIYLRYSGALYLYVRGLPVPKRILAQRLAAAEADPSLFSRRVTAISAAATAARLGHWSEYSTLLSRMRVSAAGALAAGDSARAGYWAWAVHATEAHGLWRRGRKAEALHAFEGTLSGDLGWFSLWNVGQLSLELGRLDQAERAFRALWRQDQTPSYLELARILERTGRPAQALEAYKFVAYAWRHADPELQPQVEEARQAAARLSRTADRNAGRFTRGRQVPPS